MGSDNRGPDIIVTNIAFGTVALLTVFLRCYTRAIIIRAFGTDDWIMVVATVFMVVLFVLSSIYTYYGYGRYLANLDENSLLNARKYWWLCSLFYPLTIASCKLSFAFFWFRIIPRRAYPVYSWIIYVAVFFSVVGGVVLFFVALFLCQPISYFWDKEQAGRCMSPDAAIFVAFVLSACNIATDFTFAILPVFVVWTLKLKRLKRRMKFATMFLILMGCVASTAVIGRFVSLDEYKNPDFLYAVRGMTMWSTVEVGLAVTATSLATLRPLVRLISGKLGVSSRQAVSPSKSQCNSSVQTAAPLQDPEPNPIPAATHMGALLNQT